MDFKKIIFCESEILIWVYPKTPVIAHTGKNYFLLMAWAGYYLIKLRKKIYPIKIATIIEEIVVELREYLGLEVEHIRLTNLIEKQIFKISDVLLTPSELMRSYIEGKHKIKNKIWINHQRDVYMKLEEDSIQKEISPDPEKINILISGGLNLSKENLKRIVIEISNIPAAHLYICGIGGEWINKIIKENSIQNSEYTGILNYEEHDYLASKCDFGLIHYQPGYHNFKSTIKYCNYAATGLAILSIRLKTIELIIREDGLGLALDEDEFFVKLQHWASSRKNFKKFKKNAERLAVQYQEGYHIKIWLNELLNSFRSR